MKEVPENMAKAIAKGLRETVILDSAWAKAIETNFQNKTVKRTRIVLLDMSKPDHQAFWQILHNNPNQFKITSEKESAQQTKYFIRVIFEELSDDELPLTRTLDELIKEYLHGGRTGLF